MHNNASSSDLLHNLGCSFNGIGIGGLEFVFVCNGTSTKLDDHIADRFRKILPPVDSVKSKRLAVTSLSSSQSIEENKQKTVGKRNPETKLAI